MSTRNTENPPELQHPTLGEIVIYLAETGRRLPAVVFKARRNVTQRVLHVLGSIDSFVLAEHDPESRLSNTYCLREEYDNLWRDGVVG